MKTKRRPFELYIHIPFCVRKCNYCDFLSAPADETVKSAYVNALIRQIRNEAEIVAGGLYGDIEITSIYMGGGTPSVLSEKQLEAIMSAVLSEYPVAEKSENTIEVNPGTMDRDKFALLKKIGFNRLSIGMQSADDEELKMLGRIHTFDDFRECYSDARSVGFENVSVDIMTALPGQNEDVLSRTLSKVISLRPEHISAYSLIIEENTPFYEMYGAIEGPVVGEETERRLYHMCRKTLIEAGYGHYEISNFGKCGFESRHNIGYWTRVPYIGFGLGASSLISCAGSGSDGGIYTEARVTNVSDIREYIENPDEKEGRDILSDKEKMEEYMYLGLRMIKGVDLNDFAKKFKIEPMSLYGNVIDKLIREGLLDYDNDRIKLTTAGIDYGNYVFGSFLMEDATNERVNLL